MQVLRQDIPSLPVFFKLMAPHKPHVKHRPRRGVTPPPTTLMLIKSQTANESQRHLLKKRRIQRRIQKISDHSVPSPTSKSPFNRVINKQVRQRWMEIAADTQRIVLGDGQYVEERCVPVVPCALAQRIEGFSTNPLGQVDSSTTVAVVHDISEQVQRSRLATTFYPHHSDVLANWTLPSQSSPLSTPHRTHIEFTKQSTLTAARRLAQHAPATSARVALLSSASRKRPGGGFLHGGDEQEERLARSSSLVASLSCPTAKDFYTEHNLFWTQDGSGFHDRSMVYSPGVVVFRSDPGDKDSKDPIGGSFISPYLIDVLSVVPVNAAVVRSRYTSATERVSDEAVRCSMKERMARALRVFEEQGNRHIILGAFGCGSSENKVDIVAEIWAELLVCGDMEGVGGSKRSARFKDSFDTVVFAVQGKSFSAFREAFEMRLFEADLVDTLTSE